MQEDSPLPWRVELLRKASFRLEDMHPGARDVHRILHARVPVVKLTEPQSLMECDLCVSNTEGVFKSQIVRELSRIDHRFADLVRLVRSPSPVQCKLGDKYPLTPDP